MTDEELGESDDEEPEPWPEEVGPKLEEPPPPQELGWPELPPPQALHRGRATTVAGSSTGTRAVGLTMLKGELGRPVLDKTSGFAPGSTQGEAVTGASQRGGPEGISNVRNGPPGQVKLYIRRVKGPRDRGCSRDWGKPDSTAIGRTSRQRKGALPRPLRTKSPFAEDMGQTTKKTRDGDIAGRWLHSASGCLPTIAPSVSKRRCWRC